MDDYSQSRVLEPIDSNSLSLISSSSISNTHGNISDNFTKFPLIRPVTPTVNEEEDIYRNKWQFDRKEFAFESNSTPSKDKDNILQPRIHVRKRRSQLMGAKPRIPSKLHHTTSKMELLDENRLTTLPICPPRASQSHDLHVKRPKLNPVNEIRIHNNMDNRRISYGIPLSTDFLHDSEEEENEHPIVLIEDYIKTTESPQTCTKKKVSIADLKLKMGKRKNLHIPIKLKESRGQISKTPSSSLTLVPHITGKENSHHVSTTIKHDDINTLFENHLYDIGRCYSEDENNGEDESSNLSESVRNILDVIMKPKDQDGDKYLSNLQVESQLRTCVVCDSPLYEISSLIADTEDFKEIVCGKCTEKYEEAAKIFENYEFETSGEISFDSSIECKNNFLEMSPDKLGLVEHERYPYLQKTIENKDNFSEELIRRLQIQSQQHITQIRRNMRDTTECPTMAWFLEAKKKIRWRWRVSGLLPYFLTKHYCAKDIRD